MGITAITSHQSTPRHQKNVEACRLNFENLEAFNLNQQLNMTSETQGFFKFFKIIISILILDDPQLGLTDYGLAKRP
jgi:hypothetical protein